MGRLCFIFAIAAVAACAAPVMTVNVDPSTSDTWPTGTNHFGFISATDDPLGPFSGQGVHFRGYPVGGGSSESLTDVITRYLVFRYRIDFDRPATIYSIAMEGAAFNGSQFRILDLASNVLWSYKHPTFGNIFQALTLTPNVSGQNFIFEEWDTSSFWRYRSVIGVSAVPEPTPLVLAALGFCSLTLVRGLQRLKKP
jgi:hypothetical protein